MPRAMFKGENAGLMAVAARLMQFTGDDLRKRFQASGFLRGASALFAGTVLAQATSLAIWPVLTRLYHPDQLGVLGTYIGLLTVLGAVALLRYENAIPIARHDSEANDLLALCGCALIATSVLVAAAAYAIPDKALADAGMAELAPYRFFIPFGFAWTGAYAALLSYATREAAFIAIARTRVSQALSGPASQVGMALAGFGTPGLLVGVVISQCAGIIPLWKLARAKFRSAAHTVTISGMASVARAFRGFPLISSWGALVDAVGGAVALYLLIGMFYPATVTGYLFLTERAVGRPLRMVTSSLTPVAFAEAGRLVHTDPNLLRERFLQVTRRYAMFAAAWIIVVNILAAWLFPIAFGARWSGAVPYVRAVSLWYFLTTVARAAGPLLLVLDRQILNAFTQIAGPLSGIAAFVYCGYRGEDAVVSVCVYAMCQAAVAATVIPATLMAIRRLQTQAADAPDASRNAAPPADVDLWIFRLRPAKGDAELLSSDERDHAARFYFFGDRNRWIAGRARMRRLLSAYLECDPASLKFHYGPAGKPAIDGPISFNFSNSGDVGALAVASFELGVDIEGVRAIEEDVAGRFFAADEVACLRALPVEQQTEAFFNCWTRKEAYVKALGDGVVVPLDKFSVSLAPGEPAALLRVENKPDEPAHWRMFHFVPVPGFVGAIAARQPCLRVHVHRDPDLAPTLAPDLAAGEGTPPT